MSFHKYISIILHPIVIPTVGVMLYFLVIPNNYLKAQKFTILSYVFILTYLIPLFMLIVLKRLKLVKSLKTESIKERKLPVVLMICLFFVLGNSLNSIALLKDLSLLFYSTAVGLIIIFLFFFFKLKLSIHLLSLGIPTGFFLVLTEKYDQSYLLVIMIIILLAGLLASARLNLKAHSSTEVYSGYFLGIISVFITYFFYSI